MSFLANILMQQADAGSDASDAANGFIGERSDAEAVFWYGVYSFILGGGSLVAWVFVNELSDWMAAYEEGFMNRMVFYIPVGVVWLMVSYFDSDLMRQIFVDTVTFSVLGAWLFQVRIYTSWILDNQGNYTSLWFYLYSALWITWTFAEQVI